MKWFLHVFAVAYALVATLFALVAIWLVSLAALQIWSVYTRALQSSEVEPAIVIIESIGLLAVALVALEIAQTIVEEQVIRRAHVSAPTRARRYISRFFVALVVALAIETLIAVVSSLRTDASMLVYAAWIGFATAALLAGWGTFIWLNRAAEEIEPEAMQEAKEEDEKLRT